MIPKPILWTLLAAGLVLPIVICLMLGLAGLLAATGDTGGSTSLVWVATGCGILWVLDLVCLLLALAVHSIGGRREPPDQE
jgi:fumarate reductase subunit D